MNYHYPHPLLVVFSLLLGFLILLFDLKVSHGIAEGVAYIVLVLTGLLSGRIRYVYIMAMTGTILTVVGYLISPEDNAWWIILANRGLAVFVIWTTAILGVLILKREQNLRTLIDSAVDGIITINSEGLIRNFNKSAQKIFGYTANEVVGNNVSMLMPSPDREAHDSYLKHYLETGEKRIIGTGREVTGLRKDGTSFPMELSVSEFIDGDDTHFIGILRDISERLRVEQKLREEHQFKEQLLKTAQAIIVTLDTRGRIIYINPYLEELSRYSLDEVRGEDWFSTFLPEDERGRVKQVFKQSISGVRTQGHCNTIQTKDGNRPLIEWFDNELFDSDGNLMGILAIGQDISGRRDSEKRIRDLQNELLYASRMSTIGELGTALAHELNQPLTALANYVHACRRMIDGGGTAIRDELSRLMDKAISEADRAASIIVHLRNYFEEGSLETDPTNINVIILDACALIRSEAEKRNVNIQCELEEDLPLVLIDRIQIQQVLFNLLNNSLQALEHWVKREIVIRTSKTSQSHVEVIVQDSGPGIESDLLLQRFKNVFSKDKKGMGVGLSICRSIIDAHGGEFWQTGNPGGGATFHFTVPVADNRETDNA